MSGLLKRTGFSFLRAAAILVFAGLFFAACGQSIGLGKPVDTTPPSITISSPRDGEWMRYIAQGDPITLKGTWNDDTDITQMRIQAIDRLTGSAINISSKEFNYKLNKSVYENKRWNGTWEAQLVIPETGEAEYQIKVSAVDTFRNEGAAEVSVKLDIVAPWVDEAIIVRHPEAGAHESQLKGVEFYEALHYNAENSYRNIANDDKDDFQNEVFNLSVTINRNSFSGVRTSRLNIYNESGRKLNPDYADRKMAPGIAPVNEGDADYDPYKPEWRISQGDLIGWYSPLEKGPHYIYFEVTAWNNVAWDPGEANPEWDDSLNDGAGGFPELGGRRTQSIKGTCWYQESDFPHIYISENKGSGFISLPPATERALPVDFYDDDALSEIYAALIPKDIMDELLTGKTEAQFFEFLLSDEQNIRDLEASLQSLKGKDDKPLFRNLTGVPGGRDQTVVLETGTPGEYRLLALAKDGKGSPLDTVLPPRWSIYPALRVQVVDPEAPIIIVENPNTENIFPTLEHGRKFSISGYTIDNEGTDFVQIAWIPYEANLTIQEAQNALIASASLPFGESRVHDNQIKTWKIEKGERYEDFLNGTKYQFYTFNQEFDILTDFIYGKTGPADGVTQNRYKLFVLHTSKGGRNYFKTFSLSGFDGLPEISVQYPSRDLLVHGVDRDLVLSMTASPSGDKGVELVDESIKIIDITTPATDPNAGFGEREYKNGVYSRTIPQSVVKTYEGTQRIYNFMAKDILGNERAVVRTLIFSNLPSLLNINSTNAPGTYGIGETLRFEAYFSMPVRVNTAGGTPKLILCLSDPLGDAPYKTREAEYVETLGGNTITFAYTVQPGDLSSRLYTTLYPIDPNGAVLEPTEAGSGAGEVKTEINSVAGALQNRVHLALDGAAPKVNKVSFRMGNDVTSSWYNNGKTITLELTTNKQVRISGSPRASLNYGSDTSNTVYADFSSVEHDPVNKTSTMRFTYTVDVGENVPKSAVSWKGPWLTDPQGKALGEYNSTAAITDMFGNPINLTFDIPPAGGFYGEKKAYIKTLAPEPPVFALYRDAGDTAALGNSPDHNMVMANKTIYVKVNQAEEEASLWYSLESGTNGKAFPGAYAPIPDTDAVNNGSSAYEPSVYQVTAWQYDKAGNRSKDAAIRAVEINSRFPELDDITCMQPDSVYSTGSNLNFRLAFSRPVKATANDSDNARIRLILKGDNTPPDGVEKIAELKMRDGDNQAQTSNFSSIFTFNWTVPSSPQYQMRNIEAALIELSGVKDEYGNTAPVFGAGKTRPVSVLLNRAGRLVVDSVSPMIIKYTPQEPSTNGTMGNGGVINYRPGAGGQSGQIITASDPDDYNKIVLVFDKDVWPVAGKNITIRPWGKWGLPPVLSVAEHNALYNAQFYHVDEIVNGEYKNNRRDTGNTEEYRKRLKWVDAMDLPLASLEEYKEDRYNFYIKSTNGVMESSGMRLVRPDITTKFVLAFRHDIYEGSHIVNGTGKDNIQLLRDVFNAAHWKWQIIPVTSGSVQVDGEPGSEFSGNRVTITLPQELAAGRIWEVLIDEGAFRDAAGNGSRAITPITPAQWAADGYRFWSPGTEKPVIRVDRYSHGDYYHGHTDPFRGKIDKNVIPRIDTKVRIDCETPGAKIVYDTIRTSYTPEAALNSNENNGGVWGMSKNNTWNDFFGHENAHFEDNAETGYTNNTIGNGNNNANKSPPNATPLDDDGHFKGLLVPITSETQGISIPLSQNGAVEWSDLEGKGNALVGDLKLNSYADSGTLYRKYTIGGTAEKNEQSVFINYTLPDLNREVKGHFFYVGDAVTGAGTGDAKEKATGPYDPKLYSARRDYISAVAVRNTVEINNINQNIIGPAIDDPSNVSEPGYEGVFKSTHLYREPRASSGSSVIIMNGYDTPMISSIPGFPLQEISAMPPDFPTIPYTYFTKQMYRIGGYDNLPRQYVASTTYGGAHRGYNERYSSADNSSRDIPYTSSDGRFHNNNFIWVSWDIVSNYYQKGREGEAGRRFQRNSMNYGAILCSYGALTYRYRQYFDGASGAAQ